jgi:hypothetical protein
MTVDPYTGFTHVNVPAVSKTWILAVPLIPPVTVSPVPPPEKTAPDNIEPL